MSSLLLLNTLVTEVQAAACPTTGQVTDVAGTFETAAVTFALLNNNDTVTVAGLKLTAKNSTTYNSPAKVATAFANRANGFTGGGSTNFTGMLTGWNSGAPSGSPANKVTFTATSTGNVTNISKSNTSASEGGAAPSVSTTSGTGLAGGTTITLSTLLTGNTVCVSGSAGNWEAQEFHKSGGSLSDWKHGASSVTDPTAVIGNWSIAGAGTNTTVSYNYTVGGNSSYLYTVFDNGNSNYSFCRGGNVIVTGTIKSGQVGC
jgi:hypothetical protein